MGKDSGQSELYFDVLFEILLNLPVKTLIKLKSVCKSWYSLISSSLFQDQHYNRRSQENPLLLIIERGYGILSRRITFLFLTTLDNKEERKFSKLVPFNWPFFPAQSCRGLVCLVPVFENSFCLINPSTEEMLVLPQTRVPYNCCFGFGYTTLTKRIKVVRFNCGYTEEETHCEIFTLGTKFWRQGINHPRFSKVGAAPFANGALHLLPLLSREPQTEYVSAFNLETEEFKKIRLPEIYSQVDNDDFSTIHFSDLGGKLCLTFTFTSRLELWLLNDYQNEEWMKGYTIDTSSLIGHFRLFYKTCPLAIMGDGSIMLSISGTTETKLLRYDPKVRVATLTLCDHKSFPTYYVESFFPL